MIRSITYFIDATNPADWTLAFDYRGNDARVRFTYLLPIAPCRKYDVVLYRRDFENMIEHIDRSTGPETPKWHVPRFGFIGNNPSTLKEIYDNGRPAYPAVSYGHMIENISKGQDAFGFAAERLETTDTRDILICVTLYWLDDK